MVLYTWSALAGHPQKCKPSYLTSHAHVGILWKSYAGISAECHDAHRFHFHSTLPFHFSPKHLPTIQRSKLRPTSSCTLEPNFTNVVGFGRRGSSPADSAASSSAEDDLCSKVFPILLFDKQQLSSNGSKDGEARMAWSDEVLLDCAPQPSSVHQASFQCEFHHASKIVSWCIGLPCRSSRAFALGWKLLVMAREPFYAFFILKEALQTQLLVVPAEPAGLLRVLMSSNKGAQELL